MARFGTLNSAWMLWDGPAPAPGGAVLEYTRELEKFLAEVERRAFRIAQIALRDADDALGFVLAARIEEELNDSTQRNGATITQIKSLEVFFQRGLTVPFQLVQLTLT